jgi:hypothetical protein
VYQLSFFIFHTVCGILYILYNFIPALSPPKYSLPIFSAFASTTLSVNWIITALVVFQIGQFRYQVSSSLGSDFGKPFKKIMTMCIESAALIIVFSTILLIQNLRGESPFSLSRLLLVQIYVSDPLYPRRYVISARSSHRFSSYTESHRAKRLRPTYRILPASKLPPHGRHWAVARQS